MSGLQKYILRPQIRKHGVDIPLGDLAGKIVFFYFSASWCPPCRGFTPQLIAFYNKFHESKNFEVVFVTWDEVEAEFDGYYAKMPWATLPYADKQNLDHLSKLFEVATIPCLVGVDADTGKVVTTTARNMVAKDPEAQSFPWADAESRL